ncbi:MAG TPA: metallophosphoesterase family protein [Bacteroidales bacterium]|nr:metallophosphoesterase family protein [Bacteroidales bacterium]
MKIGVLSDTHGFLDKKIFSFFNHCDEIWHAGDIGSIDVYNEIETFKPLVAVYGNIDGQPLRGMLKKNLMKKRNGINIFMTHIGGYPGNYEKGIKKLLNENLPDLFISGHSHILKVMPDKDLKILHINPGAAGRLGLHKIRTAVRFDINNKKVENLEIIELGARSKSETY